MKTIKVLALILGLGVFISCEDQLNVVPEDNVASNTVFGSLATINGAAVGVYSLNQSGDLNGNPQLMGDFMADDVNFVGSFPSLQEIDQFETLATNASIDNIWFDGYQLIGAANNVIVNLPEVSVDDVTGLTEATKAQLVAECKFLRALTYFTMVNVFAQPFQFSGGSNLGVPIVTQPFAGGDITEFQLERSTVNEVHAFIEQDLLDAIAVLPEDNGVRAEAGSARALLARLYLYREQFNDAANFANQVITSGEYSLVDNYNSFYNDGETSAENIFVAVNTPSDGPQEETGSDEVYVTFYNPAPGGRGDAPFSADLLADFGFAVGDTITDDRRFDDLSQPATDAGGNATFFTLKYPDVVNNASNGPILRITEMYLIRAEANLRGGLSVGPNTPLADINLLRTRAGLPDLLSVDLDGILTERRKELCFEGHRRMDLLRNNRNLRPGGGAVSAPGANKVIFPIVDNEIVNNPNITQNPGNF
ncbi:RagB/SusD family nutrient uptake outer membrane protein [Flagellimonas allohymeniacidonis]|uniref:RagB/SusD family nutrient uptake outer membrane protein n=1 Tax=Flagellimonas allohymeniacidonis TaxID=2517819 RepID=A0A4Q8QET9_9FLAO|nr:RagB/SusD family nutrient uptake outer membrane protein [Allomuricauda hymeniacidonis]TAI48157.1 RagB/SusD family nutrient uptake outer membrane protein [Allomuricauda hymeniacidonis]